MNDKSRSISKTDVALIGVVVDRAERLGIITREQRSRLTLLLCDAHAHAPLELQQMIDAAEPESEYRGSFAHDIAGVWNHWDPVTSAFRNCFCPRFLA